ncbi:MAG: acyltransferase family protein [Actinomycetota bacterium]
MLQTDEPRPEHTPHGNDRRYDLDALRGVAMLLGIALHAALPDVPYWRDGDPGGGLLFGFFEFVHGFRMPLFFILSGYFTTMLWRRRGLRALISHRLRRIGLPLLVAVVIVLPLVVAGIVLGYEISGADIDAGDTTGLYDGAEWEGVTGEVGDEWVFGFAHLWFLWVLLWLIAGFVTIAWAVGRLARRAGRARPVPAPLVTAALVIVPLLAVVPAARMVEPLFGPDTSDAFIPDGAVLAYYACFFAFGALAFDRRTRRHVPLTDAVGRWWPAQLAVGSLVLFPLGLVLMDDHWTASALVQVAFAWTISFGLLGGFRRFLSAEVHRVRWLSDSSYWMYLMHLPLIYVAQGVVARLGLAPIPGFIVICAMVVTPLAWSYRSWVRYTFVGTMLNGPRSRDADEARRADDRRRADRPSAAAPR